MIHYFVAEGDSVTFVEELADDQECVIKFTVQDAKSLKSNLEAVIEEVEHNTRMAKEELLASLRAKVEELEEHLAG
jgi:hypothetical protein